VSSRNRVLLTGATGHIGGRLFKHLVSLTELPTCAVIRSSRSMPSWVSGDSLVVGDLSKSSVRSEALIGIDTVVHLATRGFSSAAGPTQADLDRERAIASALVRESIQAGVSRFVFVSSIHVYGANLAGHVDDDTPTSPKSAYGVSRLRIEEELLAMTSGTHTQGSVIRLTNSFGAPEIPRPETWNLLIHDLCRQAVESSRITLRSDPRTSRDMMALRDVTTVMGQLITSMPMKQGVYLLATGQSMRLSEIAELVVDEASNVLGRRVSIESRVTDGAPPPTYTLTPRKLREAGIVVPNNRNVEVRDLLTLAMQEYRSRIR